jgi:2-oxoacid:acceptor oxidoreductase gamma subunit (pyruvate/2-ketoisovalerate family)
MLELKFMGRGGQGVVIASQMLGLGFFRAGDYPQCYSIYGGERRGAPVAAFLRVDEEPILLKCEVRRPTDLIYLDDSLLNPDEVRKLLQPKGRILINTPRNQDELQGLEDFEVGLIDAAAIAAQAGLGRMSNTALLGAYARLAGRPGLDNLSAAVEESVPAKVGANLEALRQAYQGVSICPAGGVHD